VHLSLSNDYEKVYSQGKLLFASGTLAPWSCFDSASLFKGKRAKIFSGTFLSWPNMTSRSEIDGCFRSGNRAPKNIFGKKMKRRQRLGEVRSPLVSTNRSF